MSMTTNYTIYILYLRSRWDFFDDSCFQLFSEKIVLRLGKNKTLFKLYNKRRTPERCGNSEHRIGADRLRSDFEDIIDSFLNCISSLRTSFF